MGIINRDLSPAGRGIAILGVWLGWALALKALVSPILMVLESGSRATGVVGICILFPLYIFLLLLPYGATSRILDRWEKE